MIKFKEYISEAKVNFEEVQGVRIIPKSYLVNTIFVYDEIERYDGTGRYRKNTPKHFEIERFQDEYGIDIEYMKKSDFPISYDYKTKETIKIKNLEDTSEEEISTYKYKGIPTNTVRLFYWSDNSSFLIHKDDVEKFLGLSTRDSWDVHRAVE